MSNLGLRLVSSKVPITCSLTSSYQSIRRLHIRKEPPYPIGDGLGNFLPSEALKVVAIEYQDGLLSRLNEEVVGTPLADKDLATTVVGTSADRSKTLAFNYASLALNNGFFLDSLKPPPQPPATNHQAEISMHLRTAIRLQHGSLSQLKSAFSAAALGLSSNGYIWFVTDHGGRTGILATLGPGTLLVRSRSYVGYRANEDLDTPYHLIQGTQASSSDLQNISPAQSPISKPSPPGTSPSSPTSGISGNKMRTDPASLHPRFIHGSGVRSSEVDLEASPLGLFSDEIPDTSRTNQRNIGRALNIGEKVYPLFCLPVFEHAWMSAGFGVWGKEDWLKEFWTVLDWKKVSRAYEHHDATRDTK